MYHTGRVLPLIHRPGSGGVGGGEDVDYVVAKVANTTLLSVLVKILQRDRIIRMYT
jgi:hypothetical protein